MFRVGLVGTLLVLARCTSLHDSDEPFERRAHFIPRVPPELVHETVSSKEDPRELDSLEVPFDASTTLFVRKHKQQYVLFAKETSSSHEKAFMQLSNPAFKLPRMERILSVSLDAQGMLLVRSLERKDKKQYVRVWRYALPSRHPLD